MSTESLDSFLKRAFEGDDDEVTVVKKVLLDDSANGAGIREKKWRADLDTVMANTKVWGSLLNARRQTAIETALQPLANNTAPSRRDNASCKIIFNFYSPVRLIFPGTNFSLP